MDKLFEITVYVVVEGEDEDEARRWVESLLTSEPGLVDVSTSSAREVRRASP